MKKSAQQLIKKGLLIFSFLFLAAFPTPAMAQGDFTVMTYNLRYASQSKPNSWPERRPVNKALLEKWNPDIFGTQEGLYSQLKDIARDLPQYEWIGLGREGGSRSEFMAVYFKKDRFEPLAFDHFWLSDTPEVIGSSTWGNSNRRMVTWVLFRDLKLQKEFYFVNTHWDHEIQPAREKSALLIKERLGKLNPKHPIILLGDFNAPAGRNPSYDTLVKDGTFVDAWKIAGEIKSKTVATFHNFKGPKEADSRIDWILLQGPWKVDAAEIITFSQDNQYPSDHFPVMTWLSWPK